MENVIAQRIKSYLEKKRWTVNQLSKEVGLSQPTVSRQISGSVALSAELVSGILKAFSELSAEWLLRGSEPMELTNQVDEEIMKWRLACSDLALENNQLKRELASLKGDTQSRAL